MQTTTKLCKYIAHTNVLTYFTYVCILYPLQSVGIVFFLSRYGHLDNISGLSVFILMYGQVGNDILLINYVIPFSFFLCNLVYCAKKNLQITHQGNRGE